MKNNTMVIEREEREKVILLTVSVDIVAMMYSIKTLKV
jgi:hypothetical protein